MRGQRILMLAAGLAASLCMLSAVEARERSGPTYDVLRAEPAMGKSTFLDDPRAAEPIEHYDELHRVAETRNVDVVGLAGSRDFRVEGVAFERDDAGAPDTLTWSAGHLVHAGKRYYVPAGSTRVPPGERSTVIYADMHGQPQLFATNDDFDVDDPKLFMLAYVRPHGATVALWGASAHKSD